MVLEDLARVIRQEKEIKDIRVGMEEVKLSLSGDDMILYIKKKVLKTQITKKNLPYLISEFSKVSGYKINTHKSVAFLYISNKFSEKEKKK